LSTSFLLTGDFTYTVHVDASQLAPISSPVTSEVLMYTNDAQVELTNQPVFASGGPPGLWADWGVLSGCGSAQMDLLIERTGNTLSVGCNGGTGWNEFSFVSAAPAWNAGFELAAEGGPGATQVTFSNLQITYGTPEPATWTFGLAAGIFGLIMRRRRARQ